jgi:hypothetical protein
MNALSRWAGLGAACAASLVLAACGGGGGGGDDDGDQPQTSAACMPTEHVTYTASYRMTEGSTVFPMEVTTTKNGPVTVNGQAMLREQDTEARDLSNGRLIHVIQIHYTRNADGSLVVYTDADAWQSASRAEPHAITAAIFDPPFVNRRFVLRPGETQESVVQGTQRVTQDGTTRDESLKYTRRETFHGMEEVEVPAGRIKACKFTVTSSAGWSETLWIHKGLEVKTETFQDGKRTILREATRMSNL